EAFVAEAVRSATVQSQAPFEIVVVDDGSTDDTARVAAAVDGRVRVVTQRHAGIGAARNTGNLHGSGELVACLDADELSLPTKLGRRVAALAADPTLDAVFCRMDEFTDLQGPPPAGTRAPKHDVPCTVTSGALLRRELVDRLGPFPVTPVGDWLAWWARARRAGAREKIVPEVLVRRRLHSSNSSLRADDATARLRILRAPVRGETR